MTAENENRDGYPTLEEALAAFKANRAPNDVVKPNKPINDDRPLAASGADVTYIELDDNGIPRQHTENAAWVTRPIGKDNDNV